MSVDRLCDSANTRSQQRGSFKGKGCIIFINISQRVFINEKKTSFFAKNNSVETDKNELVTFNCITDDETNLAAFLDRKKHELILYDDIYQFIKIKEENDDEVLLFENKKNETTSIASINISMMPDTTKHEKQILNYHCKISHKIK